MAKIPVAEPFVHKQSEGGAAWGVGFTMALTRCGIWAKRYNTRRKWPGVDCPACLGLQRKKR